MMRFASTILMVRPASFGFNNQTSVNNAFQNDIHPGNILESVLTEFDNMVESIRAAGIEVIVINDTAEPVNPDAVFPNNWFCTLPGGLVATFPMYAVNRRTERRKDIIEQLMHDFKVTELEDWSSHEVHQVFLEGTGSMVMDHDRKIIYACISDRTHPLLLHQFAEKAGYDVISFTAKDKSGFPVYHTNVMMCIGNKFCVACIEVIDKADKETFVDSLTDKGHTLICLRYEQMLCFAGNMLQLQNKQGEHFLVMSCSAFNSLDVEQIQTLEKHTSLLPVAIPTIESIGGGSARCMIAEIFLAGIST